MPLESFRISSPLPASAARVYSAWLDAREHTRMTGGAATVDPRVGGLFSAWDGYIAGSILELEPGSRIVQTWRSSQFPAGHPHSRLEIRLRNIPGGCEISLAHSDIPEGQAEQYEAGWHEHYFIPMTKYFRDAPPGTGAEQALPAAKPKKTAKPKKAAKRKKVAAKKAAAKKTATKKATSPKKTAKPKKTGKPKKTAKRASARTAPKKTTKTAKTAKTKSATARKRRG